MTREVLLRYLDEQYELLVQVEGEIQTTLAMLESYPEETVNEHQPTGN